MEFSKENMKYAFLLSWNHSKKYCLLVLRQSYHIIKNLLSLVRNKYLIHALFVILLGTVIVLGGTVGYLAYKMKDLSSIDELNDYDLYEVPSVLYDVNGTPFKEFSLYKREITPFEKIPTTIIDTLIAAEDKSFYSHRGVNFLGILRAMLVNIVAGRVEQGGSTLTQQLSKLLFTNRERNISRKIKELFYAFQIEKKLTKEEILEKYLNKVYYANGIYSIASAAQYYFDLPIEKINYAQAALLISIPPSPTYYNPITHPINVKNRQKVVMGILIKEKKITPNEAENQTNEMWDLIQAKLINGDYYKNRQSAIDSAPYFSEYIRRILYKKYGDKLYTSGYKIYTTLNVDLQQIAQNSINLRLGEARQNYENNSVYYYNNIRKNVSANNPAHPRVTEFLGIALGLPYLNFYLGEQDLTTYENLTSEESSDIYALNLIFNNFGMNGLTGMSNNIIQNKGSSDVQTDSLEAAIVATETKTGRILSMVGGSGFKSSNQINRVYQASRQPGSTFKPFLYLAALSSGRFTAADTFDDNPIAFQLPNGDLWMPGNSGKYYSGSVTLREALRRSLNIISVKLIQAFGINQTVDFVSSFLNIDAKRFQKDSSIALGTAELSPLELNKGFATIANEGKEVIPHAIIEIKNRYNQVIESPEKEILMKPVRQLVDPRYNYIITSMLLDVMQRGTAAPRARAMNLTQRNLGGKTGTASNMTDSWFSGFSPDVAATVWIGFDRRASLGLNAFGSVLAEPIWIEYMKEVIKLYPYRDFTKPSGVLSLPTHKENGLLLKPNCLDSALRIDELFTEETKPMKYSPYCGSKVENDLEKNAVELENIDIFASK